MNIFLKYHRFTRRIVACLAAVLALATMASVSGAPRTEPPDRSEAEARFRSAVARLPLGGLSRSTLASADETIEWQDGAMQWTQDYNCFTRNVETTTGEFVGYLGNANVTFPRVGDIYYGRAMVGAVGNPCGGIYAHIEIILPENTYFAGDAQYPVRCFYGDFDGNTPTELPMEACPQIPSLGTYGWVFDRPGQGPWPLQRGQFIMVAFPIYSTTPHSGIATNSLLVGGINVLDGETNPWDDPRMGVFVAE